MSTIRDIPEESKDYHRKQQQNIRLTDEGAAMLRALSHFYGSGMSAVVELLVRERVHERKINVSAFLKRSPAKRPAQRRTKPK